LHNTFLETQEDNLLSTHYTNPEPSNFSRPKFHAPQHDRLSQQELGISQSSIPTFELSVNMYF